MDVPLIFAACAPGLEPFLAKELRGLGLEVRELPGGVEASGPDAVALACLGARAADAVSLRVYRGPSAGLSSALGAARRRFGPQATLAVRREAGRATVSLDAGGKALYRRGWRARIGRAPLRESLAAGMLLAAGYDGEGGLLDPMCGSGTLVLEAAEVATRRAPGRARRFAFEQWPEHDPSRLLAVRERLLALERPPPAPLLGSDRNAGAVRLAQKNAAAAGYADTVHFARRDAAAVDPPPPPALIAVNPPYGLRLAEEVENAWRALGILLARSPHLGAVVLAPSAELERLIPRRAARTLRVRNGGLPCRLLLFEPR
ncbi:MAG TPA: RNA methyltransferase [Anaeromyxobacteraceae bacterium]|nr:RNA methyltransferase [Anaeromyxobacteraceae bacterium]